jgi:hypothetical protein
MTVFLLQYVHDWNDGHEDVKLIGVYFTRLLAEAALVCRDFRLPWQILVANGPQKLVRAAGFESAFAEGYGGQARRPLRPRQAPRGRHNCLP